MTNTIQSPIAKRNGTQSASACLHSNWLRAVSAAVGLFSVSLAHADTWFFVEDNGVLHYANERVDERYHRFSMNDLEPGDGPLFVDIRAAAYRLAEASEKDRSAATRYFANSSGYKLHAKHIRAAASKLGVDEQLLKAIATAESGFNATAVSPKGAIGLMQVIPDTAARFGLEGDKQRSIVQKLKDPAINVPVSARYVRYLQGLFPGRTDLVVAAYNAGEGAVQRYGNKIPPYKETQNYVKTVMTLYASLQPNLIANNGMGLYGGSAQLTRSPTDSNRFRMTIPAADDVNN
ncbi:lytic transglycosylase domain-containing protein [Comamonas avium]|uniref:Lytic transglycosylase domain-containing protein n=1 Tax=Comamonas avium TaxID=2762231 RepID=A0ABR8SAW6_9BURK|nr:lytic transglycosylase domain-containing protein [Comamonas avium]MBD7960529.1 lytic transglycosylase domain-containing protein [Comamonas avium]